MEFLYKSAIYTNICVGKKKQITLQQQCNDIMSVYPVNPVFVEHLICD